MEVNLVAPEAPTNPIKPGPKQQWQPKHPRKPTKALGYRTLAQFPRTAKPELQAHKFTHPDKCYRLVWVLGNNFWLCGEDETLYRKVHGPGGIVEAGKTLTEKLDVKVKE
jgi:hypothetical protein